MNTNISVQIPKVLNDNIEKLAAKHERTKSFYVRKALELYINRLIEDEEDIKDGRESLNEFLSSGQEGYSIDELRKDL